MKSKKEYLFFFTFIAFIIIFPVFILFCQLQITFERPDIIYKGNKTVSKEDIIYLDKITLRDLKIYESSSYYGEKTHFLKYYLIKGSFLSKKNLKAKLLDYCKDYYKNHNSYDEIGFFFYEECGRMPWFWNNDGFFPDLEMNSDCLICRIFISKEEVKFLEGGW